MRPPTFEPYFTPTQPCYLLLLLQPALLPPSLPLPLLAGMGGFLAGLWNATMALNEKGYYFTVLLFGLFAVISLQKTVRDQLEKIPVTGLHCGLAWFATLLPIVLLLVGLWNATLTLSEKGFYAMSFLLALFGVIIVQKNTRDMDSAPKSLVVGIDSE